MLAVGESIIDSSRVDPQNVSPFRTFHATEHFRIAHANEPEKASIVGELLEKSYQRAENIFAELQFELKTAPAPMDWICFSDRAGFESYALTTDRADVVNLNGYFSTRTNQVVLYWGKPWGEPVESEVNSNSGPVSVSLPAPAPLGTLSSETLLPVIVHESVHQIAYNRGLQKPGLRYPLWVSEGLAIYLESLQTTPDVDPIEARLGALQELHRATELVSLSEFVLISDISYDNLARIQPLYTQAWGLFRFLTETRPAQLPQYIKAIAEGGRAEPVDLADFERHFGGVARVQDDWHAWLKRLAR